MVFGLGVGVGVATQFSVGEVDVETVELVVGGSD